MADTLFLLGAGASCKVLPLAANFAERLSEFGESLQRRSQDPDNRSGEMPIAHSALQEALEWLGGEGAHHASIDTFAKKLYFRHDHKSLNKLKAALSSYLVIEQGLNNVDMRYDSFLATLLQIDENERVVLPKNLRIMTWNYDTQLEQAFYGFCDNKEHVLEQITHNSNQIFRVNGCCGTFPSGHYKCFWSQTRPNTPRQVWEAGLNYFLDHVKSNYSPTSDIRFAWEDKTYDRVTKAMATMQEFDDLVVVGYSFPYFNRNIDSFIFSHFYRIKRIYL